MQGPSRADSLFGPMINLLLSEKKYSILKFWILLSTNSPFKILPLFRYKSPQPFALLF